MSVVETEARIRASIAEMFLDPDEGVAFHDDTDLLEVLDSLQLLRLVIALESIFQVKFRESDMSVENLGSVRRMAAFVCRERTIDRPTVAAAI